MWAKEPPPTSHPLLQFDNVLVSPHMAGVTREARANMGKIAAEQLLDALDGKAPPRIVNPQAWPLYARRFEQVFGSKPAAPAVDQMRAESIEQATKKFGRMEGSARGLAYSFTPAR